MPTVKFWGVQGSCPGAFHKDNLGSNTACVSIELEDTLVILDSGTGIRTLSSTLDMNRFNHVILLITHSHWDHIQGFPFFSYIYQKKPVIIYSHLQEHINGLLEQMNGINFPLTHKDIPSEMTIITNLEQLNQTVDFTVNTIQSNHQGNCIGYRIKSKNCDVCYIPDNQLHHPKTTSFDEFVEFCKDTTLLIHDSQYTKHDMPYKIDWGHSLYTDALELSIKSNAKKFALFHHEPTRKKDDILTMVNECNKKTKNSNTIAATELMEINLLGN